MQNITEESKSFNRSCVSTSVHSEAVWIIRFTRAKF